MAETHGEITHVGDTALMVAACRALEFELPDGFLSDPFAARLAGERGMAILRAQPNTEMMRFGVAVRSRFIDELLMEALRQERIATVVSAGCGLDTRPWRLELPRELRWIEVDFADMLDYKDARMAGETPRCRRERQAADLNDAAQRRSIYAAVGMAPALMITEGLLMYLPAATVEALAADAAQESGIAHWITEIMATAFRETLNANPGQAVRNVLAADSLRGEQILEVVKRNGWEMKARRSYISDMGFARERVQRVVGDRANRENPPAEMVEDATGVHRFGRI